MSNKGQAWHFANDTPEQIQMCLSCKRPRCVNCIDRPPDKVEKDRERYARKHPSKSGTIIINGYRLNKAAQEMIRLYPTAKTDKEIGEKIDRDLVSVGDMRRKIGFPPPSSTSPEERFELAKPFLQAMGAA